jgi:hypothetical protein
VFSKLAHWYTSALPSSNWMVTTVSGAARAAAGTANRQPAASAADATARDRHPGIQNHPVMIYSSGRRAIWMAASATRLRIRRRGLTRPL